jgi:hypothetical protein
MKMKSKLMILTVLFLLCFYLPANSAYWESPVTEVGSISPAAHSDWGRILLKFDLPGQLTEVTIDYAELLFHVVPDTGSSYIRLMGAFPVAKSWEKGSISWSSGWDKAGGDYLDSIYSSCRIRTSPEELTRVDITSILQMWIDGIIPNYGLILIPLEDPTRLLELKPGSNLPNGAKAMVRVFYTK